MTLVERLRDENYRGAFQHLRNCTEIDSLFSEAAVEIEHLEKALEKARVFVARAQVAFLWPTEGIRDGEMDRFREAYWDLHTALSQKKEG